MAKADMSAVGNSATGPKSSVTKDNGEESFDHTREVSVRKLDDGTGYTVRAPFTRSGRRGEHYVPTTHKEFGAKTLHHVHKRLKELYGEADEPAKGA